MSEWTEADAVAWLDSLTDEQVDQVIAKGTPEQVDAILSRLSHDPGPEFVELAEQGDVGQDFRESVGNLEQQIGRRLTQREIDGIAPYGAQRWQADEHPDAIADFHRWQADTGAKPATRQERVADDFAAGRTGGLINPDALRRGARPAAEDPGDKPGEGSTAEERREWRRSQIAWNVENPEPIEEAA